MLYKTIGSQTRTTKIFEEFSKSDENIMCLRGVTNISIDQLRCSLNFPKYPRYCYSLDLLIRKYDINSFFEIINGKHESSDLTPTMLKNLSRTKFSLDQNNLLLADIKYGDVPDISLVACHFIMKNKALFIQKLTEFIKHEDKDSNNVDEIRISDNYYFDTPISLEAQASPDRQEEGYVVDSFYIIGFRFLEFWDRENNNKIKPAFRYQK